MIVGMEVEYRGMGVVQICRRTQRFSECWRSRPQTPEFCACRRCVRQIFASFAPAPLGSAKPHALSCCLRQALAASFSCWSAARRTFPDTRALVCCYRFFCIKVASPWRPFLLCPPQCDNPNTMIDLDDKENQSPLRLGFGNSPSPKRSRTKNTATAGQDVSDALSKQSPSGPLALVA